jgi:hypothetical protein
LFELGNLLFLCQQQRGRELMGEGWGQAVINIKPLLCPIRDVGREIDVKEGRFVGCLDPKDANDLSVKLRKNVKATTKQCLVGFDPHEVLTIGNKCC